MKRILLLLFIPSFLFAQETNKTRKFSEDFNPFSVGLHLGSVVSLGDYRAFQGDNAKFDFGFGLDANYMFNHVFGLEGRFMMGSATGGSEDINFGAFTQGSYSDGSFLDASLSGKIAFGNLTFHRNKMKKWNPYLTAGIGFSNVEVTNFVTEDDSEANSYSKTMMKFPLAMGTEFRINDRWNVDLNFMFNVAGNDNWDGMTFGQGTDVYLYSNVGVNYIIGKQKKGVEWVYPMDQMYLDLDGMKTKVDDLSKDTDDDGIPDYFDKDNNTPKGVAVDGSGKPLDVDGDGVPDYIDVDPFTPKGATVDASGREMDGDGDGVPDSRDLEPNTPKGNMVNFQGKSIPTGASAEVANIFMPSVFFELNSSTVTYSNYERLAVIGKMMKSNGSINLVVIGYADPTGSANYNKKLGEKRAKAVVDHLVKYYGISESRFTVESKGEDELLTKGINNVNRRVDFTVKQ
jgi:OmpA-OmpF porin, OOP family